jgi:hypothetical protein
MIRQSLRLALAINKPTQTVPSTIRQQRAAVNCQEQKSLTSSFSAHRKTLRICCNSPFSGLLAHLL